jgi:hypothetical protein
MEIDMVESIREANNERNYNLIKPYLSQNFHFSGSDVNTSFTTLYAYLNFQESERISKIEIDYVKDMSDSVIKIKGTTYYENYDSDPLNIEYQLLNDTAKIQVINSIKPHKFPLTTRASYRNEEIFGDDPVSNITNLLVLDKSSADSISKRGYTLYFDESLAKESELALSLFGTLDSLLKEKYLINDIERENLFLTTKQSNNTITVGRNRNIPWTMALSESDSVNQIKLRNKIGNTFSHEIIEGTLVQKYKLKGYEYRWFRDGLSEYMTYVYCQIIAAQEAESYFINQRLTSSAEFAKNGHLLDWRGNGPIESVDQGKLFGQKFIYGNDVGQYGRAFKLFKDLFEDNEELLIELLKRIKEQKGITRDRLLNIMSEMTNQDMIELIGQY